MKREPIEVGVVEEGKLLLCEFNADYADEFDVCGLNLFTSSSWNELIESVTKTFSNLKKHDEIECYFGTNEALTFYSLKDYLSSLTLYEITQEEHNFLKDTIMPYSSFGTFKVPSEEDYGSEDEDD
jgi:hypothetical protein